MKKLFKEAITTIFILTIITFVGMYYVGFTVGVVYLIKWVIGFSWTAPCFTLLFIFLLLWKIGDDINKKIRSK